MVRWYRLGLSILLTLVLGWFLQDRLDELKFHFSSQPLEQLGNILELNPDKLVKTERYVEITGVLGNKAALISGVRPGSFRIGPIQIRQVLGAPLFVEFDQHKWEPSMQPFSQVTVKGRLVDFGTSKELEQVRGFWKKQFGKELPPEARLIVMDEAPWHMWRYPVILVLCLVLIGMSLWFGFRGI